MFPVRCYTCNAALAQLHPQYRRSVGRGDAPIEALEALEVRVSGYRKV